MSDSILFKDDLYQFRLVDIRDVEPDMYIYSNDPGTFIFAILAGRDEKLRELLTNLVLSKVLISSGLVLTETLNDLKRISSLRGKKIKDLISQQNLYN